MSPNQLEAEVEPTLDAYRFFEHEWDSYEELYDAFEWTIPETFNIATYVCDRWAGTDRTALVAVDRGGTREHSFADLQTIANRFSNYLQSRGIQRGDRVAVSGAQRVEVLATHLA